MITLEICCKVQGGICERCHTQPCVAIVNLKDWTNVRTFGQALTSGRATVLCQECIDAINSRNI